MGSIDHVHTLYVTLNIHTDNFGLTLCPYEVFRGVKSTIKCFNRSVSILQQIVVDCSTRSYKSALVNVKRCHPDQWWHSAARHTCIFCSKYVNRHSILVFQLYVLFIPCGVCQMQRSFVKGTDMWRILLPASVRAICPCAIWRPMANRRDKHCGKMYGGIYNTSTELLKWIWNTYCFCRYFLLFGVISVASIVVLFLFVSSRHRQRSMPSMQHRHVVIKHLFGWHM